MIQFDKHIIQIGLNHQLVYIYITIYIHQVIYHKFLHFGPQTL